MTPEELLAQLDDLLRTTPDRAGIHSATEENLSWLGRAVAVLGRWDSTTGILAGGHTSSIQSASAARVESGYSGLLVQLHQARHDLKMMTAGPTSVAVEGEKPFQYFDELRKIIELSQSDILFVDPYMEAEFVSRYLPFVRDEVGVRLLVGEKIKKTLAPAVQMFTSQNQVSVEIRSGPVHDRYVFIDRRECHQSGASFKDGAMVKATSISQIVDAFSAMSDTYEAIWESGTV